MRGYDAWLEKPYQDAQAEGERWESAWEQYCDEFNVDYEDDSPEHRERMEQWLQSMEDDARISQYEDYLESKEWEMNQ